jgi:branched-chain amino acid transport system substrate-binding protein
MHITRSTMGVLGAVLCSAALAACGGDDDDDGGANAAKPAAAATTPDARASGTIDPDKPPVRFAFISMKIPGINLLDTSGAGAQAAAKKINAEGGFGGRRVIIDTCNSMAQPATATTCAHRTLAKNPIAQFGCEVTWSASGLQVYAKAKVPSFNCVANDEDFTNPWSFGISGGGHGERAGLARFLCTRDDVKKVAVIGVDIPSQKEGVPAQLEPPFKSCGKEVTYAWLPLTAGDATPHVQKVLAGDPDWVMTFLPTGVAALQVFKALQQSNFPPDHTSSTSSSFGYETALEPAGALMDGTYSAFQFHSWGDTADPDVQEYLQAMEGAPIDARNSDAQWGYHSMLWFYTVAEKVGFDAFDAASLTKFMNEETDVPMILSRKLVNPGPKGRPQVKQPYVQIVQWKDGKLNVVQEGTEDGWIMAF